MKELLTCLLLFSASLIFSQNEPWKRPLKICRSTDGVTFTSIQTFQDSSGVPNVIKLPSGTLISVFQWFRQPVGSLSWDRVAVKFSSDNGISWTQPQPIVVNGLPANFTRPFDPTLAVTDNGRIRIFFSDGMNMIPDTSVNTYSAISNDGVNYTMEPGIRFSLPDRPVLDPAVIKFNNLWHLVNPNSSGGTGAYHNISGDGLNFTRVSDIASDMAHSWIGNFMIKDTNELRFYGSGMNVWYSSSTNGGVWSGFVNTNINGGDPSVLKISETNYLMIYTGMPYSVELSYFLALTNQNNVTLQWGTVSETNNERFDIERKRTDSTNWMTVGNVPGNGTTSTPHDYVFHDSGLSMGMYNYRLKQIDFNGSFQYYDLSNIVIILAPSISGNESSVPGNFVLYQNYPNPFNPVTHLEFGIPNLEFISLKVYDALGIEVEILVNENKPAGNYVITFDGSNLSSGIYFYSLLIDGNVIDTKRMTLLK